MVSTFVSFLLLEILIFRLGEFFYDQSRPTIYENAAISDFELFFMKRHMQIIDGDRLNQVKIERNQL